MTNGKEEDQTSHGWHTRIYCGQKIYNSIHTKSLVDLAPIAFSLFTTCYFTKQCGQWGLFLKSFFQLQTSIMRAMVLKSE